MTLNERSQHRDDRPSERRAGEPAKNEVATSGIKLEFTAQPNHVYFYGDVTRERCLEVTHQLRTVVLQQTYERALNGGNPLPVHLHVQSDGGEVYGALTLADRLDGWGDRMPIITVAEGSCMSSGTIISVAGTRRLALPTTTFLIHQFTTWWTHTGLKFTEMQDEMVAQEILFNQLVDHYVRNTRMDADTVRRLLARDTFMDVDRALELGLIDGVVRRARRSNRDRLLGEGR